MRGTFRERNLECHEWNIAIFAPTIGKLAWVTSSPITRTLLFNKLMALEKGQIDAIKMQPIQVHYHQLAMHD